MVITSKQQLRGFFAAARKSIHVLFTQDKSLSSIGTLFNSIKSNKNNTGKLRNGEIRDKTLFTQLRGFFAAARKSIHVLFTQDKSLSSIEIPSNSIKNKKASYSE